MESGHEMPQSKIHAEQTKGHGSMMSEGQQKQRKDEANITLQQEGMPNNGLRINRYC